jgi:hypothetical protein
MEIGVWMVIGFGSGFSAGIAVDRLFRLLSGLGGQRAELQAPSKKPPQNDPNDSLPPFPRLKPPPR